VRTDGGAIAKGFGGGIMVCGDPPIEFGGDVGMLLYELPLGAVWSVRFAGL